MSVEEKKKSILKFFQNEYSFYNMKELEKLIPKKCPGISSILVKDLIQMMIDEDGIVSMEKCGSTNMYWCFKNQIDLKIYESCEKVNKQLEEKSTLVSKLDKEVSQTLEDDRSGVFEINGVQYNRTEQLMIKKSLDEKLKQLGVEYKRLTDVKWDKENLHQIRAELVLQNKKLEKITDNIELVISYLAKRYYIESETLRKEYEVPIEFVEYTKSLTTL